MRFLYSMSRNGGRRWIRPLISKSPIYFPSRYCCNTFGTTQPTIYNVVEYYDSRKEVYLAIQGYTTDKKTACKVAEQLCRTKVCDDDESSGVAIFNVLGRGDLRENHYIDIEERANGKLIALYCAYDGGNVDNQSAQDVFADCKFQKGKNVTIRDLVVHILGNDDPDMSIYKELELKFEMTKRIGKHHICTNPELVADVLQTMLMSINPIFRKKYNILTMYSGVMFAVFETNDIFNK